MKTYDLLMTYLLEQGPIVGLVRFCLEKGLDYSWTHAIVWRAQKRQHVEITRCSNMPGKPDRIVITKKGTMYIRSLMPIKNTMSRA